MSTRVVAASLARVLGSLSQQRKPLIHDFTAFFSSTSSTSFFSYNSGRARRRRRLRRAQERNKDQQATQPKTASIEEQDTRTVMDILFPNPFKGEQQLNMIAWPKTWSEWKEAFTMAWSDYRSTWQGFATSKGFLVEEPEENEQQTKERKEAIDEKRQEVIKNVTQNTEFLKHESEHFRTEIRERTGIHSKEDLRKWAADMMRLASDSVNHFMSGYRKGRDDEVEKMLTEYFQELEEEANKPKKRKPKRRVLNRYHPMSR